MNQGQTVSSRKSMLNKEGAKLTSFGDPQQNAPATASPAHNPMLTARGVQ